MVSFRDQENNGKFELVEQDPNDETIGREYIFVSDIEYSSKHPDSNIAQTGGHTFHQLYFFWPTLVEDATWAPS